MKVINVYSPVELRNIRKEEGLTQYHLALIMGLSGKSKRLISAYERGNREAIPTWRAWELLNLFIDSDKKDKKHFVENHKVENHKVEL